MAVLDTIEETKRDTQIYDIKIKVINIATNEFSKKLVYHNIAFINRVVEEVQAISNETELSKEETFELELVSWLIFIGLAKLDEFETDGTTKSFLSECCRYSSEHSREIMTKVGIIESTQENVVRIMEDVLIKEEYDSIQSRVMYDAFFSDFAKPLGSKYLTKLYRELMLLGVLAYSKHKWLVTINEFLIKQSFKTDYGQENFESGKIKIIHQIEKKIRDYRRTNETILKKEMNISASELKQLKKTLKKVKGRNERGVQTMFRTTSRNHYTLNQMLDRKANILISINTIILSVVITKVIGGRPEFVLENMPVVIMMSTALISILFAILAILPEKTHGEFTETEIRNKGGNLLFFGNYYNMSLRDYTWGMLQMINDGEHLYMTMIRDLYYFGKQLAKKYKMLRFSLFALGFGLTLSTVVIMIISNI